MFWDVDLHPACLEWLESLTSADQEAVLSTTRLLARSGPALGRPLVDSIKGSRHKNMKELRPPSAGRSEMRILFAFDPRRRAILLVGGDKSNDWHRWYQRNVPIADARFDDHLRSIRGTS